MPELLPVMSITGRVGSCAGCGSPFFLLGIFLLENKNCDSIQTATIHPMNCTTKLLLLSLFLLDLLSLGAGLPQAGNIDARVGALLRVFLSTLLWTRKTTIFFCLAVLK